MCLLTEVHASSQGCPPVVCRLCLCLPRQLTGVSPEGLPASAFCMQAGRGPLDDRGLFAQPPEQSHSGKERDGLVQGLGCAGFRGLEVKCFSFSVI